MTIGNRIFLKKPEAPQELLDAFGSSLQLISLIQWDGWWGCIPVFNSRARLKDQLQQAEL